MLQGRVSACTGECTGVYTVVCLCACMCVCVCMRMRATFMSIES